MKSPSRRKPAGHYHHGDLRRALIDAALKLIQKEGVSAVTTRALARQLGVSHAAPAHHFKDREALLGEVATEGFRIFAQTLEAAAQAQPEPSEKLVSVGKAYVRFAADHPAYLRVMFGSSGRPENCEPAAGLQHEGARAFKALTDAVEAVMAERRGPQPPLMDIAITAWSLVHGLAMLWIDGPARAMVADLPALEALTERAVRRLTGTLTRQT